MTKVYRQGQILKAIRRQRILTQDELARRLKAQGIVATQVTLSRDIRDLGLVKTADGYQLLQAPVASGRGGLLLDAKVAQNLLVLKTPPAHAASMARTVDEQEWPEVVGTVAGDDTVLVVAADHRRAELVRKKVLALVS
jgi:transcriptional regulator of arginine metabolism